MKITLSINTKTNAHLADIEVEATAPPRIGEYVETPSEWLDYTQQLPLLVTDVRYQIAGIALTATVTCIARGDDTNSHRLLLLEEQGWLQPRE